MKRSMQKAAMGAVFIPVGLVAAIIGLATTVPFGPELVALGLVLAAAGFMEIEIAAIWLRLEVGA